MLAETVSNPKTRNGVMCMHRHDGQDNPTVVEQRNAIQMLAGQGQQRLDVGRCSQKEKDGDRQSWRSVEHGPATRSERPC